MDRKEVFENHAKEVVVPDFCPHCGDMIHLDSSIKYLSIDQFEQAVKELDKGKIKIECYKSKYIDIPGNHSLDDLLILIKDGFFLYEKDKYHTQKVQITISEPDKEWTTKQKE